jgi:hypothetical protein
MGALSSFTNFNPLNAGTVAANNNPAQQQVPGDPGVRPLAPNNSGSHKDPANQGQPVPTFTGNRQVDDSANLMEKWKFLDDTKDPVNTPPVDEDPMSKLTAADIGKQFGNVDLSKSLDQEKVKAALDGDINSFMEILNTVGREAASAATFTSLQAGNNLTKSKMDKSSQGVQDNVRTQLKAESVVAELGNIDPRYTKGLVSQAASDLATKYARKYPQSSPQEIATAVRSYLNESEGIYFEPPVQSEREQRTDWDNF